MKAKRVVTVVLLVFVVASVAALVVKNLQKGEAAAVGVSDGVVVYYLHGKERCETCMNMEANTREAIEAGFADRLREGSMAIVEIDYDAAGNEHYARDFEIPAPAPAVVLERRAGGEQQAWKNLDQAFELAMTADKQTFVEYVQQETKDFLKGAL
jgi:hypothetical protein